MITDLFPKSHWLLFFLSFFLTLQNCSLLNKNVRIKPLKFNYENISSAYFTPQHADPFPLTVQRGNNLYNSTTRDGRYLFYTTGQKGNFDIHFRDLDSSIVVPVTEHPSAEYKPAISPDGRKLVFVSEQYDSEGDLMLLQIDPSEWTNEILQGNRFIDQDFVLLTDAEAQSGKVQRTRDQDPYWSPDSRRLVFSTEKFSPGIPNLAVLDTDATPEKGIIPLTKDGGVAPFWSMDGARILYISYKDSALGEIYSINLTNQREIRITSDNYIDFSPSISADNEYIYFTSIREDTNHNGRLDERDSGVLVQKDARTGAERYLTAIDHSLFDTRYSNFNHGSIIFSASIDDTVNIFYIPSTGAVPKQESIEAQYDLILEYAQKQNIDEFALAMQSLPFYFKDNPLFPVFWARGQRELLLLSLKQERSDIYEKTRSQIRTKLADSSGLLSNAYLDSLEATKAGKNPIPPLEQSYRKWKGRESVDSQQLAEILVLESSLEKEIGSPHYMNTLTTILKEYPDFYRGEEIRRRIALSQLQNQFPKIPEMYLQLANQPENGLHSLRELYADLDSEFLSGLDYSAKIRKAKRILEVDSFEKKSVRLHRFFLYVEAVGYNEADEFSESNAILDSFIAQLPKEDPLFFRAHLLKSWNLRALGQTQPSLDELRIFLENYSPSTGVALPSSEMERSFLYFETKARNHDRRGDLKDAALHYFFNTENMFLAKSVGVDLGNLYEEYGVYYQRKMVEAIFKYSKSLNKEQRESLLGKVNVLSSDSLDVLGAVSRTVAVIPGSETLSALGDFRDLQFLEVLSPDGLKLINNYYKEAIPRAQANLDYATIYGYAYYLINKSVINETFYTSVGALTTSRKESILKDCKNAEYQLKWIIFADPSFYEAHQLLGWLFQYIDLVKERQVAGSDKKDGEEFAGLYAKYFPEKHFEENIEIYRQILELLGSDFANKKILSDLHLNLANNYFLLMNYPKSLEHYKSVEDLSSEILTKAQFDNYEQRALYWFHYARAAMYVGEYSRAIGYLEKVIPIYEEYEYLPILQQKGADASFSELKDKLVVLHALLGLAYTESERFENASLEYEKALGLNQTGIVDAVNLYNALAMSYQKLGRYDESSEYLKKAEILEKQREKPFWAKTLELWKAGALVYDFFWRVFLPDEVRINGEGRFPAAFPEHYKTLLSQGIGIQNSLNQREYEQAVAQINERLTFIGANDLDYRLAGKIIRSNSYRYRGFLDYQLGNYESANQSYLDAAQYEKSYRLLDRAESSLRQSDYIRYASYESARSVKDLIAIELDLRDRLKEKKKEKKNFLKICMEPLLNSELNPVQVVRDRCERDFYRNRLYFDPRMALDHFYLGKILMQDGKDIEAALHLGDAIALWKEPAGIPISSIGLSSDRFSKRARIRFFVNQSISYQILGDRSKALDIYRKAEELAYEFFYNKELISIYSSRASYQILAGDLSEAKRDLDAAENLIRSDYHLITELNPRQIQDLYYLRVLYKIKINEDPWPEWETLNLLTQYRSFLLSKLEFSNASENALYQKLQSLIRKQRQLYEKAQYLLSTNGKADATIALLENIQSELRSVLIDYRNSFSWRTAFLSPEGIKWKAESILPDNVALLQVQSLEQAYLGRIIFRGEILKVKVDKAGEESLKALKDKFLERIPNSSRLLIWPVNMKLSEMKYFSSEFSSGMAVSFISGISDLLELSSRAYKNMNSITYVNPPKSLDTQSISAWKYARLNERLLDTDILVGDIPKLGSRIFTRGDEKKLDLREIFTQKNGISFAVIPYEESRAWEELESIYSLLRSSGIAMLFISPKPVETALALRQTGKDKYDVFRDPSVIRFGVVDLNRMEESKWTESDKGKFILAGKEAERKGDFGSAYEFYYLANSIQSEDQISNIRTELNMLRNKWKLLPKESPQEIYGGLLNRFSKLKPVQDTIRYAILLECAASRKEKQCERIFSDFQSTSYTGQKAFIEYLFSLETSDPKAFPAENIDSVLFGLFDSYLMHRFLAHEYIDKNQLHEAEAQISYARKFANTSEERQILDRLEMEERYHDLFLDGEMNDLTVSQLLQHWDDVLKNEDVLTGKNHSQPSALDGVGNYRNRLVELWKKTENGDYIDPLLLYPDASTSWSEIFSEASVMEKSLAFYLGVQAISHEKKGELKLLFDKLIQDAAEEGDFGRAASMLLGIGLGYLERGDLDRAKEVLDDFKDFGNKLGPEFSVKRTDLESWISLFGSGEISELRFEDDWLSTIQSVQNQRSSRFVSLLNQSARSRRLNLLDPAETRRWKIFILYLQKLAIDENNSDVFLDLASAKEHITIGLTGSIDRFARVQDIPAFIDISRELKAKIPKGQELIAIVDFGIKTFKVRLEHGKTTGTIFMDDNRKFRAELLGYYAQSNMGGYEVLIREELESSYRRSLDFQKDGVTYLYLDEYHWKAPFSPKEDDKFFLVAHLDSLVRNGVHSMDNDFQPGFRIQIQYKGYEPDSSLEPIKDLEEFELKSNSGKNYRSVFWAFHDPVYQNSLGEIYYGKSPIQSLNRRECTNCSWVMTSNYLGGRSGYDTSLRSALFSLDRLWNGPGVISLNPLETTVNAKFLDALSAPSKTRMNLPMRFHEAVSKVREFVPYDTYWNGYRLYTNSFVK